MLLDNLFNYISDIGVKVFLILHDVEANFLFRNSFFFF